MACSDGAVRLVDTSPQRAASVVRTSYAHGVEATAVAISHEGRWIRKNNGEEEVVEGWKPWDAFLNKGAPKKGGEGWIFCVFSKDFEYIEVGLLNGNMDGFV